MNCLYLGVSLIVLFSAMSSARAGYFTLHEGNRASQNDVCTLHYSGDKTWKLKKTSACSNDEARSMTIYSAQLGDRIAVYDDPNCGEGDDFAVVKIRRDVRSGSPLVIGTFERSLANQRYEVAFSRKNGLDGKVSCVKALSF